MLYDIIAAFANTATALGLVFAACTYYRDAKRKLKQDTLEAYRQLQRETLSAINQWKPVEIRVATENTASKEYAELSCLLAEIEHFCLGINEGIYDFNTFYELSHGYFDGERSKLKPRIIPLMEAKLDKADEDYFENIHKVWKKMDKLSEQKGRRA